MSNTATSEDASWEDSPRLNISAREWEALRAIVKLARYWFTLVEEVTPEGTTAFATDGNQLTALKLTAGAFNDKEVALSQALEGFPNLQVLSISFVRIAQVPDTVGGLERLVVLELRNNRLTALPATLARMRHLRHLNLSYNSLTTIPIWIGDIFVL